MSRRRWLALVVTLTLAPEALAKPNVWDVARDPRAARAEELLERADRARIPADPGFEAVELQRKLNERSALMIQLAGGEELGSTRLLYLLGDCLVHASGDHNEEGRAILLRALAEAPHSPSAAGAWFAVAIASSLMGDHETEYRAYGKALEIEWDQDSRARIYLNRGESSMAQLLLPQAIADYRAALNETNSAVTRALANWGLAVALDRSMDFPAAVSYAVAASQARFGPNGRQMALDLSEVFFTPRYEVHYYRALALQALTRQLSGTAEYQTALENTKLLWLAYISAAPEDGPWVPRAKQHLRWINRELRTQADD